MLAFYPASVSVPSTKRNAMHYGFGVTIRQFQNARIAGRARHFLLGTSEMIVRERFRGLFRKYLLVLFMAVAIPLAINGIVEAWFGYRDQQARLDQLLGVQATAAAAEIHDFIYGITNQLGWLVQVPWSDEPDEQRRTEALRLFRQAPAIVSLALLDNRGLERLYVSRIGLNRIESRTDRSADPAVIGARSAQVWFSDVSYHRGSEPHLTVAVVGNRPSVGVVIAEVNLKLIWDVISAIKVGKTGFAFVLDRPGRLIAHPDISLVLRGAEGQPPGRSAPYATQSVRREPASRQAGMSAAVMLPPSRRPLRVRIGLSSSNSRSLKPTPPSMQPYGGLQRFSRPVPCSPRCLPMHWRTG